MAFALADRTDPVPGAPRGEPSGTPSRARWRSAWQDIVLALLFGGVLLWPVVTLVVNGLTPTGMAEESLGRRYFYSLRILYGEHERPFLPQGQLASVAHFVIHLALTAAGFPPTQLFPRIDLFAYSASIVPIVLATLAFGWAVRPIASPLGKLLVALLLLVVVFDPGTTRGYHLVQTDYYSWVHAVALVVVGAILRVVHARSALGLRSGLALGALAAVAMSIKPTYAIFLMPLGILLLVYGLARREWIGVARGLLAALVIAAAGTVAVHLVYYLGDLSAAARHLTSLASFVESIDRPPSVQTWLGLGLGRWQQGETLALSIGLVPVLALSALLLPNRVVSVGLLTGAAASLSVAWRKFHPNTLIETNDYAFVVTVLWAALVLLPAVRASVSRLVTRFRSPPWIGPAPLTIAGLVLAFLLGARLAEHSAGGRADMLRSFGAATRGARTLADYLESRPGRLAFLIPENDLRPLTVDSAIYKGGTNESGARWGDSPYVQAMFPDRHYFVDGLHPALDPDPGEFSRIVFVRLPEDRGDAVAAKRLRESFGIWLGSYDCDFRVDLIYQEIVACEQRVVPLAAEAVQQARFVPLGEEPAPVADPPERATGASSTRLVAAEKVGGRGLALLEVQDAGRLASVVAPDGARVWIEDLGVWDAVSRRLSGLYATASGGLLRLDATDLAASNPSPRFDRVGSRRQPLVGWQLEPRDALPAVELLRDADGPFVRVRPAVEGTTVVVSSRTPLSTLDDTPVTVRAVVRVHGERPVTLTIADVVARGGETSTRQAITRASDQWETLSVWLRRVSFPDDRDSFSVRLADPVAGSWMDLREVSLIQGVVP